MDGRAKHVEPRRLSCVALAKQGPRRGDVTERAAVSAEGLRRAEEGGAPPEEERSAL